MEKMHPEEVSLLDVLAGFFASLRRNILLSILLPLLGVLVALGVAYNSKDKFESSLLIETSLLSESESKFLFKQLDKVGIIPGLTKQQDDQVAGFDFDVIRNDNTANVNLNEKSLYLQVTATVFNKEVFPLLEKAVVNFVNQSKPVVRHRHEREKFYSEMISKIDRELSSMEEVKNDINSRVQATYLNPSDLYSNSVALYREKTEYEIKREEIKVVHLVKGFDTLTFEARRSKLLAAVVGFVIGVLLLLLVLFTQFFSGYLKTYETSHPVQ